MSEAMHVFRRFLFGIVVTSSLVSNALAGGIVGNGNAASCTEAAFDTALVGGGTVTFNCGLAPVTIGLTTEKQVSGVALTINGANLITLDGADATRLFNVAANATFTARSIVLTNGVSNNGGAILNAGTLTLSSVTISSSASSGRGGAIRNTGVLNIEDSTISGNTAATDGGGISTNGAVVIEDSVITANTAVNGGGLVNTGTVDLTDSSLVGNNATGDGGGLVNRGTVNISGSALVENASDDDGGAIDNFGALNIVNSTLFGNTAADEAGGIRNVNVDANMVMTHVTLAANDATNGGGIRAVGGGTVLIRNSVVSDNGSGDCINFIGNAFTVDGVNFDSDGSCTGFTTAGLDDIRLGGLQANGSDVRSSLPLPGSVLLDSAEAGFCVNPANNVDQRGVGRFEDADGDGAGECDVGATELQVTQVGQGDPAACSDAALSLAIANSELVDLDCGVNPVTINTAAEFVVSGRNVAIRGISDVTLDAGGVHRHFDGDATSSIVVLSMTLVNGAEVDGAAIRSDGFVQVQDSTLSGNNATGNGGALDIDGGLFMISSTLSGNTAGAAGGAVRSGANANIQIANTTLSGNSAASGGGVSSNGSGALTHVTIANNSAATASGIEHAANLLEVGNSLIASNNGGTQCAGGGAIQAVGVNISTDNSCVGVTQSNAGNILLGGLQNNGGSTLTHGLGTGSLAIDSADNGICSAAPVSDVDQRGVLRDADCDVGAFEVVDPQAPFLDLNGAQAGIDNTADFVENNGGVLIVAGDGFITDADSANLQLLTVTINNRLNGVDEVLAANTQNTGLTQTFVNGVLEISGVAAVSTYNQVLRSITYENLNETPNETNRVLDVTAEDGLAPAGAAQVTVTVTAVNDPPVLVDDEFNTDSDTTLDVIAPGVLANDSDAEDGSVTVFDPFSGRSTLGALVSVNADGSFGYDPDGQFDALGATEIATDTFQYSVRDSQGEEQTATVTILVTGINDEPVANDDVGATDEDTVLIVAAPGVLSNDADINAQDILSVDTFDATSSLGAVVTMQADGSFTYDPQNVAALQNLAPNQTETDTFTYSMIDGQGGSDSATVSITVSGLNDRPNVVAPLVDLTVFAEDPLTIQTAQAFEDPDVNDTLTFSPDGVLPPGLSLNATTGVITGSVPESAVDEYVIVVNATDSFGASRADGFVFDVLPIPNRAPFLAAALLDQTIQVGDSLLVDVSANYDDPDGDTLSFSGSGFPLGFSIDAVTGVISGTADLSDAAGSPHAVTITATDPSGLLVSDEFLLTIENFGDLAAFIGNVSPFPAIPGGNVTVPVTVTNNAATDAAGVFVDVTLNGAGNVTGAGCSEVSVGPPRQFSCSLGTVAAGVTEVLDLNVTATLPQEQWLAITVRGAQDDTDLTDNSDAEAVLFTNNSIAPPVDCLNITATALSAGNMDADSDSDFIIGTGSGAATQISFNTAGSLGTPAQSLGDASNTQDIALGDFDGNGRLDILAANVGANLVFFNNADGFVISAQTLGADNTQGVAAGDVDGDGDIDLVFANGIGQNNVVALNNGNAAFVNGATFATGDARDIALVNIDSDTDLDIVFVEFGGVTQIRGNDGNGQFNSFTDLGTFAATSLAVGDINGDTFPDLVIGVGRDPDNPTAVPANQIFTGNGAGTFTSAGELGRSDTQDVYLVDIDGDLDLDLITRSTDTAQVFYLNNGAGVFTQADAALLTELTALAPVDANGDNRSDLLLATPGGLCLALADNSGGFVAGGTRAGTGTGSGGSSGAGNAVDVNTGAGSSSGGGAMGLSMLALLLLLTLRDRLRQLKIFFGLLLAALSFPSQAGSWFIGGNLGSGFASSTEIELGDDLRARGHNVTVSLDEVSFLGSLYGGYRFNRNWELTAGYLDLGNFDSEISGNVNDINALLADLDELHPGAGRGVFTNLHRSWSLSNFWRIQGTVGLQALSDTDIEVRQGNTIARTNRGTDVSWNAGLNIYKALENGLDVGGSYRAYNVEGELIHTVQLSLQRYLTLGRRYGGISRGRTTNNRPWGFDQWGRVSR